jgi:hypothetical protein
MYVYLCLSVDACAICRCESISLIIFIIAGPKNGRGDQAGVPSSQVSQRSPCEPEHIIHSTMLDVLLELNMIPQLKVYLF